MSYLNESAQKMYSSELSIEVAELTKAVKLPSITLEPLTIELFHKYHSNIYDEYGNIIQYATPYRMPYQVCTNVIGCFYVNMMFPLVENGEPTIVDKDAPNTSNVLNKSVTAEKYSEQNYIELVIPKYIAMNFYRFPDYTNFENDGMYLTGDYVQEIPKGTKFLCAFIGGSTNMNNISIIGILGDDLYIDDSVLPFRE